MSWNGRPAAISLTFDDGLESHRQHAVPMLEREGLKGTFFLIPKPIAMEADFEPLQPHFWQHAAQSGHEIGSHSMTHRKAANLTQQEALKEAIESRKFLQELSGQTVNSFCYPYTDAPSQLQKAVKRAGYGFARGGRLARASKFIRQGDGVNRLNLPAIHVSNTVIESEEIYGHITEAIGKRAWIILMFHAIGAPQGWDNVHLETFKQFLQTLSELQQTKMAWVAPMGEVGAYLR